MSEYMLSKDYFVQVIRDLIVLAEDRKEYFTDLDSAIGDGDHGINLARGFDAVKTIEDTFESKDIGAILKAIGMKLVSTVGGASGPLYGTAFMKSGALLNGKTEMDMNDFIEMLQVSIDGIMKRGKAVKGEKTMLDAMIPAHDAIKASYEADGDAKKALDAGVKAAEEGIEYTVKQIDAYRALGVNGIHLYALNKWKDVSEIIDRSGLCTLV